VAERMFLFILLKRVPVDLKNLHVLGNASFFKMGTIFK
jgi:hypothetical protein